MPVTGEIIMERCQDSAAFESEREAGSPLEYTDFGEGLLADMEAAKQLVHAGSDAVFRGYSGEIVAEMTKVTFLQLRREREKTTHVHGLARPGIELQKGDL
jgi:hypothetical protein